MSSPWQHAKQMGIIYIVNRKKCDLLYVGHTEEMMSTRFSKHKYDINKRPKNNELTEHCHGTHDTENDLEIFILDHGIPELGKGKFLEDKYICKLQTIAPNGMNVDMGSYAKEIYSSWTTALKSQSPQ